MVTGCLILVPLRRVRAGVAVRRGGDLLARRRRNAAPPPEGERFLVDGGGGEGTEGLTDDCKFGDESTVEGEEAPETGLDWPTELDDED